jgi:hypothetical protein
LREESKKLKDKRQKSSTFVNIKDDLILAQSCGIVPRKKGGKYKKYKSLKTKVFFFRKNKRQHYSSAKLRHCVLRKKGGKWRESRGLGGNSYVDLSDNANR